MGKKCIILLFILLFPYQLSAAEKETIIWINNSYPPIWILEGPNAGKGVGDLLQALLQKKLKDYNHVARQANVSRLKIMMKNGEKVCACAKFKTPDREKIMYFSKFPSLMSLSPGIITTRENRHLFGDGDAISLCKALKNPDLRFGITHGRKFGAQIDNLLAPYREAPNFYERVGLDVSQGVIMMLLRGRFDYIIGYDWELQYMQEESRHPERKDDLIFVPIQEIKPYILTYIACTRNEWGRSVLERIDKVLKEEIPKADYFKIFEQWGFNKALYKKLYESVLLESVLSPTLQKTKRKKDAFLESNLGEALDF